MNHLGVIYSLHCIQYHKLHQESSRWSMSLSPHCVTDWWFLQAKLMDYVTCSHGYLECWSHSRVSLQGGGEWKWNHLEQINESLSHFTHAHPLGKEWLFAHLTVTSLHIWDLLGWQFCTDLLILRLLILWDIKSQIANVLKQNKKQFSMFLSQFTSSR